MKLPKGKRNKKDIYKQIEYLIYDTRSKKETQRNLYVLQKRQMLMKMQNFCIFTKGG